MEISTLKMFVKVAELKSFSKAATALNIAQSYVSTRIHQYERKLGTELFIRHNKGVELSSQGVIFLDYANRILSMVDEAENTLSQNSNAGLLRISTMQSTAQTYLPAILSTFHRQFPEFRLRISTSNATENIEKLFRYEAEFVYAAGQIESEDLALEKLTDENLVLISNHKIKNLRDFLSAGNTSLLAFPFGCAYRKQTEKWLNAQNISLKNIIECDSIPAILSSVTAGMGYAVLPRHLINDHIKSEYVYAHELPDEFSTIPLNLCYRRDMKLNDGMKQFIKINKNIAGGNKPRS